MDHPPIQEGESLIDNVKDSTDLSKKLEGFKFEPVPKPERVFAGKAYTLDGLAEVWFKGDQIDRVYPEPPEFSGFPAKWKEKHLKVFLGIVDFLNTVKVQQPKRSVPMLMQELQTKDNKEVLKDLEKMGIIQSKLVQLMENGKRLGGRVIVWITPEGYSLLKGISK